MKRQRKAGQLLLVTIGLLTVTSLLCSCRARYHTIRKEMGGSAGDPPQTENAVPRSGAPAAAIEIMKDGTPVTEVQVNDEVIVQPTASTRDPDNSGDEACRNAGIVRADYQWSDGTTSRAERTGTTCSPLGVPRQIATPGSYDISMTVTSDEGETASASTTLIVSGPNDQPNGTPPQGSNDGDGSSDGDGSGDSGADGEGHGGDDGQSGGDSSGGDDGDNDPTPGGNPGQTPNQSPSQTVVPKSKG